MGEFADGIKAFNTRGRLGPRVTLTKRRAMCLENILKEAHVWGIPDCEHYSTDENCHCNDDYYAAIAWVHNQINKRWSRAELHTQRKKRKAD